MDAFWTVGGRNWLENLVKYPHRHKRKVQSPQRNARSAPKTCLVSVYMCMFDIAKAQENHVTLFCFPPPSWRLQHLCNRPRNGLRGDVMYAFIRFYPKHTHKSIKSILIQRDRALDIQNKTQQSCVMEVPHMTQTDRT